MNPVIRTRVSIITREDAKVVEQVHVIEEKNRNFFEINCNVFFERNRTGGPLINILRM